MPGRMGGTPEQPARFFHTPEEFSAWLALHHDSETSLWMGLKRKHVADRGLTWEQAVPEALCWGWIDSVAQRIDGDTRRQRWTPRKKTSHWSRINLDLVEKLPERQREMRWVARVTRAHDDDRLLLFQQPIVAVDPARPVRRSARRPLRWVRPGWLRSPGPAEAGAGSGTPP